MRRCYPARTSKAKRPARRPAVELSESKASLSERPIAPAIKIAIWRLHARAVATAGGLPTAPSSGQEPWRETAPVERLLFHGGGRHHERRQAGEAEPRRQPAHSCLGLVNVQGGPGSDDSSRSRSPKRDGRPEGRPSRAAIEGSYRGQKRPSALEMKIAICARVSVPLGQ